MFRRHARIDLFAGSKHESKINGKKEEECGFHGPMQQWPIDSYNANLYDYESTELFLESSTDSGSISISETTGS